MLVGAFFIGSGLLFVGVQAALWHTDYSREPAATVFQHVLGQPVPRGVTNLKAAGRAYAIKHWVWISFQATDEALATLAASEKELFESQATLKVAQKYSAHSRYDRADQGLVGWRRPATIPDGDVYEITGLQDGWMWGGYMIIDQRTHTVYVHAGDI
jgi:hypothetical protein